MADAADAGVHAHVAGQAPRPAPEHLVHERLLHDGQTETAVLGRDAETEKPELAGAVDQLGTGYTVSARLVSAETGEDLIGLRESAEDGAGIIDAVGRLSRKLRARIGESLGSVNATKALPDVTTRSLPALERFAAGTDALRAGDRARAVRLLEEATRLDTTFAYASGPWTFHGTGGLVQMENTVQVDALTNGYRDYSYLVAHDDAWYLAAGLGRELGAGWAVAAEVLYVPLTVLREPDGSADNDPMLSWRLQLRWRFTRE